MLLNPSVVAGDEVRLGRQGRAMLALFRGRAKAGYTVSTLDMAAIGCQYNARINEFRHYLAGRGEFIDRVAADSQVEGVYHYRIVPFEKSGFARKEGFRA